jgi:RimJ/RimL family protein N-acetyltransferase
MNESTEATASQTNAAGRGGRLPTAPPLRSRRVFLRAVHAGDLDYLYALFTRPDITFMWRLRGATPPPDQFANLLWQNVLCQFMICRRSGEPIGLISAYNADLRNGFAYLAMIVSPEAAGGLFTFDASVLFINYLFYGWNLRKLYGETTERHLKSVFGGAVGRVVEIEGRLREHELMDGSYSDAIIVALYREKWKAVMAERLSRILQNEGMDASS